MLPGVYEPRATPETVLHQVVRSHLDRFLTVTAATDGAGLPRFIEREFRDFLGRAMPRTPWHPRGRKLPDSRSDLRRCPARAPMRNLGGRGRSTDKANAGKRIALSPAGVWPSA